MNKKILRKMILAVLVVLMVMAIIHSLTAPRVVAWTYHAVMSGDTLWSIARKYNPEYIGDVRNITHEIKKANGMTNSQVFAGDLLEVPVMER